jgi:acetylornithine deacetylase
LSDLLARTLTHLRALVGFDTRNPPRAIDEGGIFGYLRAQLGGFDCTMTDHGAGAVSLYAVRGKPKLLFNVHLDTVPDSPHWSASPFELRVDGERAIGLGACDIKGAAAAMLAAASAAAGDAAFLFTSDEEANDARCIAGFLAGGSRRNYDAVIVAEPTRCEAVLAHRGISSVLMRFAGRAGHASGGNASTDSAVHQAMRWGSRALDFVETQAHARFGGLTGLRFNIGRVEGGIKANVIAPAAEVRFGFRPLPSMDTDTLLERFRAFAGPAPAEFA